MKKDKGKGKSRVMAWAPGLLLCAALAACSGEDGGPAATSGQARKTIHVQAALLNEVWTPPPWSHRNDGHWPQWWFIYDRLVENNQQYEAEHPNLARSWEVSPDELSYTFHLRDDVRWHDGLPFTARDVETTFLFILDPYLNSPAFTSQLMTLEGLEEYRAGRAEDIAGIQVIDDHTIRFSLARPVPFFLYNIALTSILPRHQLEVVGESSKVEGHALWRDPGALGTGPFRLAETVPFQFVRLTPYEDYHMGAPKIGEVIIHAKETALAASNGELDLGAATPSAAAEIARMPHMEIHALPTSHITSLTVNVSAPALRDVRVRRALLHAIDRLTIAETMFGAYGEVEVPDAVMPAVTWRRNDLAPVPYDPQKARQLLGAAGWDPGTELEIFMRDIDMAGIRLDIATIVQGYWKEVGVEAKVVPVEAAVTTDILLKGEFDFYMGGWAGVVPVSMLRFRSDSPTPAAFGYSNPEVDAIAARIDTTFDRAQLRLLYDEMQKQVWEDAAFFPILNTMVLRAKSKRLKIVPRVANLHFPIGTWWHLWDVVEQGPPEATSR